MWSREDLKNYAKDFLRKHYLKAFLVCLIVSLLNGAGSSNSGSNNSDYNNNYNSNDDYYIEQDIGNEFDIAMPFDSDSRIFNFMTQGIRSPLFFIQQVGLSLVMILFLIFLVTVGFALEVGQSRFFLRGFEGDVSIKKLFSIFNSQEYFSIVKTQLLRRFYNFLWTLLLVIPGIIKSYEYRFVPYILSEEANLTPNEVISRSREITNGHKMDMFILDLSFIGWYFLGGLFFGIGVFFVDPYNEATYARLYNVLSNKDNPNDILDINDDYQ